MTSSAPILDLPEHEVHLWFAPVPASFDPSHVAAWDALLAPHERERQQRFHFEKDRRRHLLTRALARTTLSRYAPIDPADWTFAPNAHGRPAITNALATDLHFNLTHSGSLVALAVTVGREIGIDTEDTGRHAPLEVADRYFSADEATALRQLPAANQAARFWELWTFKESYIKARGLGLALPLDGFSFRFDGERHIDIAFGPAIDDDPARWQFRQLRPNPQHLLALCVEDRSGVPLDIVCREARPLFGEHVVDIATLRASPQPPA
jgi:4'-phosphopantetheinyl transferase